VSGLSTNACKIEKLVWDRSVSGDKRCARGAAEKVLAGVWLDSNKFAVV